MLKFYKDALPSSKIGQMLLARLASFKVEGDWLNGVPTLDHAYWFAQSTIQSIATTPASRAKLSNTMKVFKEPKHVYVALVGVITGTDNIICGWKEE